MTQTHTEPTREERKFIEWLAEEPLASEVGPEFDRDANYKAAYEKIVTEARALKQHPTNKPKPTPMEPQELCKDSDLYNRTPGCPGTVVAKEMSEGGGTKCTHCQGWFCY